MPRAAWSPAGFENDGGTDRHAAGYTTGMLPHYFASKQESSGGLRLSLTREARGQADNHAPDLLAVLTEALPIDDSRFTECAFWTAFWGQVSTAARQTAQRLGAPRIREAVPGCIATHWPQSATGPRDSCEVLLSIMTFINGLTASAVEPHWPAARQIERQPPAADAALGDAGPC